jgi:hypothetical protein
MRRLASPNKQTAGLQGWQNVGEAGVGASEATDLASRTLAALRRRTFTVCYVPYVRRPFLLYVLPDSPPYCQVRLHIKSYGRVNPL